jgi:RsiW-degrading membrane proteinase PrsW (M82 family)
MTATAVVRTARISAAVICAAGLAILAWVFAGLIREFSDAAVLAVGLELPVVVTGYWLARLLRPVRPPSRLWSAAAVLWGATAATGCAIFANQGLTTIWAKGAGITFASNWGAALNEELLKVSGVAMIVLAVPGMIRGPLDGMVFGALAGLGFQVMENVTYGLNAIAQFGATNPPQAVAISAFVRVVITGLGSHWTMTAVSGAGIGFLVSRGARRGWLPAAGCLATAMGMRLRRGSLPEISPAAKQPTCSAAGAAGSLTTAPPATSAPRWPNASGSSLPRSTRRLQRADPETSPVRRSE